MPRDPFPATRSTLIGPNAILQIAEALRAAGGEELTERLFLEAGLGTFLLAPPEEMVGEELVARLHETVAEHLASEEARMIAVDAGRRTARYILAQEPAGASCGPEAARCHCPARLDIRRLGRGHGRCA